MELTETVSAILPILILILAGGVVARLPLLNDAGWAAIDRFVYFVLFPALLFRAIATADLGDLNIWPMGGALILAAVIVAAIAALLKKLLKADGPATTSLIQGSIRFNTYLGVAMAESLFGDLGLALTAVCVAFLVPSVNLTSVLALTIWGKGAKADLKGFFRALLANPLILACLGGAAYRYTGWPLPDAISESLSIAGDAALAIGLIAVGAGLDFLALKGRGRLVVVSLVLKLALLPAVAWGTTSLLGVDGMPQVIGIFWLALPAAPSAYVLARAMGGDAPLIAACVTAQLMGAILTLPIWLNLTLS